MRFKTTIFLLAANAALFLCIWSLERDATEEAAPSAPSAPFTRLEISGKGIDKPRILELANNRWTITSPVNWRANLFAVNRIRNQLEFLDRETGFSLDEMAKHGHDLAEYGLDDPVYVFRYGNGERMQTLKIGKNAPVGNRVYMLDEAGKRIVVVGRDFVNGLIVDIERLRNQNVFDIPRFEVSAVSIRLPVENSASQPNATFRRVGLVRDAGKWKFETPISADADPREVENFLNEICQATARDFDDDSPAKTGFDLGALPSSITLEGTNRRQVLLLGPPAGNGGSRIYARLEDNPTVFTVDAAVFKNLASLQDTLREKSFFKFDPGGVVGIDVSRGGTSVNLRKLRTGVWDAIGGSKNGEPVSAAADVGIVNDLLVKLGRVRARQFVSDAAADKTPYGIGGGSLRISLTMSDQTGAALEIGSFYEYGASQLVYASVAGGDSVYGISRELSDAAKTDFLHYRSRILEVLPDTARIKSLSVSDLRTGKILFEAKSNNGNFDGVVRKLPVRKAVAAAHLLKEVRNFSVKRHLDAPFSAKGFDSPGTGKLPWVYALDILFEVPGGGSVSALERRRWYFTERAGGTTQYGGAEKPGAVFEASQKDIDALFELAGEYSLKEKTSAPVPAAPKK